MGQHLKRINAPKTWHLLRKEQIFVSRPRPGRHAQDRGIPLLLLVRDHLHKVDTLKELKYLITNKAILINGKVVREPRTLIGIMDVLSLHADHYRIIITRFGRYTGIPIPAAEANTRIEKIIAKHIVKGMQQVTLMSGMTFLTKEKYAVGDSLVLVDNKVSQHLPLKEGMAALIYRGKSAGRIIHITKLEGKLVHFVQGDIQVKTNKDYVLALGEKQTLKHITEEAHE
ncbi:MAG: hypothetical protein V1725_06105 [archaeon]